MAGPMTVPEAAEVQLGYGGLGGEQGVAHGVDQEGQGPALAELGGHGVARGRRGAAVAGSARSQPRRERLDERRIGHGQRPVVPRGAGGQRREPDDVGGWRQLAEVARADLPLAEGDGVD